MDGSGGGDEWIASGEAPHLFRREGVGGGYIGYMASQKSDECEVGEAARNCRSPRCGGEVLEWSIQEGMEAV